MTMTANEMAGRQLYTVQEDNGVCWRVQDHRHDTTPLKGLAVTRERSEIAADAWVRGYRAAMNEYEDAIAYAFGEEDE